MKRFLMAIVATFALVCAAQAANNYNEVAIEKEATDMIAERWGKKFRYAQYPKQNLKNEISVAPGESIQKAINEMSKKGGGVVKLLAGKHPVKKTIHLKSNVSIVGEGVDKSFIVEEKGIVEACLMIGTESQVTDVLIKDLTLKGHNINSAQGLFITGVNEARHQRIMLQNFAVTGWGSHGVHIKRTNNIIMDKCTFNYNGIRNGLYHNLYFLFNKEITQSDCNFSHPIKGKGCKYTSCEFVMAQRCVIENCIANGVQADNEETGYIFLHKYRVANCGQVALWFPCEYYFGKFDYTEDPKYAPQNIILNRCEIVDNTWGAMWRVVKGSYVINSHFDNRKIDMGLLLCDVKFEGSTFEKGNKSYDDVKQWPLDVQLLW